MAALIGRASREVVLKASNAPTKQNVRIYYHLTLYLVISKFWTSRFMFECRSIGECLTGAVCP